MKQLEHQETQWSQGQFPIIVACDNWSDPRNVGMAFRLADAFGVEAIWLGGTTPQPPNRKIRRTARMTTDWVSWTVQPDLASAVKDRSANGYTAIGIEITNSSFKLRDYVRSQLPERVILVLGAEKEGIDENILAILDDCIHIPMHGRNSSLNVATALAISLEAFSSAYSQSQ